MVTDAAGSPAQVKCRGSASDQSGHWINWVITPTGAREGQNWLMWLMIKILFLCRSTVSFKPFIWTQVLWSHSGFLTLQQPGFITDQTRVCVVRCAGCKGFCVSIVEQINEYRSCGFRCRFGLMWSVRKTVKSTFLFSQTQIYRFSKYPTENLCDTFQLCVTRDPGRKVCFRVLLALVEVLLVLQEILGVLKFSSSGH